MSELGSGYGVLDLTTLNRDLAQEEHSGSVILHNRVVDMLSGEQLPRIC